MDQPQQHPFRDYSKREVKNIPDFRKRVPFPFPKVDEGVKAQGWTFSEFLQKWKSNNYQEDLWWKFKHNEVICFGSEGRKLFLGIAEIVISFHKEKKFSGNLVSRIRVLPDLNVTHESPAINNEKAFEYGGQKKDIQHFRWMVAAVVRKAFPDYLEELSEQFCLFFSEIFLTKVGVQEYFVSQLYHPIFFNSSDRCSLIRMIRHLYKLNPVVFQNKFRLKAFESWWSKIEARRENGEQVQDTLSNVLYHRNNHINFYYNHCNGCTLPLYIRNVHEHLKEGETDPETIDLELDDLFPGISAVFIDSAIRNFHGYWTVFGSGTTLSDLQLTPPHGWCFPYYRFRN